MEQSKTVTLVATDLDGTLLNNHKQVSEATRQALKELKNRGILFGVASGRPVESGIELVKEWGLEGDISYLIGMNGAVFYDMRTHQKQEGWLMDGQDILEIMDHFKDLPVIFQAMIGNDRYVSESNEKTQAHARLFGENEMETDLAAFLPGKKINKLIMFLDPKDMETARQRSQGFDTDKWRGVQTADNLFEYIDPAVSKAQGLKTACAHYGIRLEDTVAFGDAENDIAMLKAAGTGVAMANAAESVKAAADVVSLYTNEEDALAVFALEEIYPYNTHRLERNANAKVG
jgi:hypothetical protein